MGQSNCGYFCLTVYFLVLFLWLKQTTRGVCSGQLFFQVCIFLLFALFYFLHGSQVEHGYYVMTECMHAWDLFNAVLALQCFFWLASIVLFYHDPDSVYE